MLATARSWGVEMIERLKEGLSFEWRAEWHAEVLLEGLADAAAAIEQRSRLDELAAAARTRRTRLERRLQALSGGARLAPVPPLLDHLDEALELALAQTRASADRYGALAELSRRIADPETAFACELNRSGAEESALLIDGLLTVEVERSVALRSLGAASATQSP